MAELVEFTISFMAVQVITSRPYTHGSIIPQGSSPGALGRNRTTWELGLDHSRRDAGWDTGI